MKQSLAHQYNFSADLIRVLAILGVVSIHVVLSIYNRPDFQGGTVWWISNIWNAISRSSIPLFIMLSGYLLIPRQESSQKSRHRILYRLVVPLLFWFFWYRFWRQGYMSYQDFRPSSLLSSLAWADVGHLYFLVIMIGLYTILPYVQKHFTHLHTHSQKLITTILLILSIGTTLLSYHTQIFPFNNSLMMWVPYLGYFLAGQVLGNITLTAMIRYLLVGIFVTSVIATAFLSDVSMTAIANGNTFLFPLGALSPYFDFYLSPNVVIMSLTAFVLLISSDYQWLQKKSQLVSWIKKISSASFGIYLLHLIVVNFIEVTLGLGVDFVQVPLIVYLFAKFTVVFTGAYLLTLLLRRFAFFRKTLGE